MANVRPATMRQASLPSVQGGPGVPAQREGDQDGHFRFVQRHLGDDLSHNALDIFKGLLLIYYGFHLCVFMGFVSVSACVSCAFSFFSLCFIILAFFFQCACLFARGREKFWVE